MDWGRSPPCLPADRRNLAKRILVGMENLQAALITVFSGKSIVRFIFKCTAASFLRRAHPGPFEGLHLKVKGDSGTGDKIDKAGFIVVKMEMGC